MPTKTEEIRPGVLYIGDEMSPLPTTFEEYPSHLYTLTDHQDHVRREICAELGGWLTPFLERPRRKRMSRKRFVKKLMAEGMERNRANEIAECIQDNARFRSYAELFSVVTIFNL